MLGRTPSRKAFILYLRRGDARGGYPSPSLADICLSPTVSVWRSALLDVPVVPTAARFCFDSLELSWIPAAELDQNDPEWLPVLCRSFSLRLGRGGGESCAVLGSRGFNKRLSEIPGADPGFSSWGGGTVVTLVHLWCTHTLEVCEFWGMLPQKVVKWGSLSYRSSDFAEV